MQRGDADMQRGDADVQRCDVHMQRCDAHFFISKRKMFSDSFLETDTEGVHRIRGNR